MTPEDQELLQEKLTMLCHFAGVFGLPEDRLLRGLAKGGFEIDGAELQRQLRYLESKGWITTVDKELRPDLRRWVTRAPGDEFLMRQGLI